MKLSIFLSLAGYGSQAQERCGKIQFGKPSQFAPVSLSSFPGSGNTWARYLIEEYTGYYTGSVYHDGKLYRGGFKGEKEEWREGRVVITKTHTFRPEYDPLTDAVILIRNPYDCFLSEFNRITSGSDHTGKASNADFMDAKWVERDFPKLASRWLRLYTNLLKSGNDILPIIYEEMKADPKMEMKKIVKFLDVHTDYESKYDCLFGDNSLRFKRSSYREYDPYLYIDQERLKPVNKAIMELSALLNSTHGIELPITYQRDLF